MKKTLTILALSVPLLASAVAKADVANGKRLAERWCNACHIVSPEQKAATTDASPFPGMSRQSSIDPARLALFLLEPHPKMPGMSLTRTEAADIASYINSVAQLR